VGSLFFFSFRKFFNFRIEPDEKCFVDAEQHTKTFLRKLYKTKMRVEQFPIWKKKIFLHLLLTTKGHFFVEGTPHSLLFSCF